jgi:hypothetical protein
MKNKIDSQLKWIVTQLIHHEVNYWLDSGSLLGIVRDGKLIDSDGDIDIGIWENDLANFDEFSNVLSDAGYKIRKCYYKEKIIKCKLMHFDSINRVIDINIFRKLGSHSWCIQPIEMFDELTIIQRKIYTKLFTVYKNKEKSYYDKFPFSRVLKFGCWWVPTHYFSETKYLNVNTECLVVPYDEEAYLKLRYGEWRIPNSNWNFIKDDGALLKKIPAPVEDYFSLGMR